jgi:hypothetical protein
MAKIARYDPLYGAVLAKLPSSAEDPELYRALADAGRKFCESTKAWQEDLGPFDLVTTTAEYVLTTGWDADIDQIVDVRLNTVAGVAAGTKGASQNLAGIGFDPATDTLVLVGKPAVAVTHGLDVTAVLVPTKTTHEIAEWFLNRYSDALTWEIGRAHV